MKFKKCLMQALILSLFLCVWGSETQAFNVEKILDNGPDEDCLVWVILGDGYTSSQISDYRADVSRILSSEDGVFSKAPWSEYKSFVNIYVVDVISNESGADYEDGDDYDDYTDGALKDTYLGARYWTSGMERLLTTNSYQTSKTASNHVPTYDDIFVIVNADLYGGSGGSKAVVYKGSSAPAMMLHEYGHTYSGLADEYTTPYIDASESKVNCTAVTNRNLVKWRHWFDSDDEGILPIPTPETNPWKYNEMVGLYEGCMYQSTGWYRPQYRCTMKASTSPFCAVCAEDIVLEIFSDVDIIRSASPAVEAISIDSNEQLNLSVITRTAPNDHDFTYQWKLNGVKMSSETASSLSTLGADLSAGVHTVSVVVVDETLLVRNDSEGFLTESHSWTVTVADPWPHALTVVNGTGDGTYTSGTLVSISATIPANYHFDQWTGGAGTYGDVNEENTTYTTVGSAEEITASFIIDALPTYGVTYDGNSHTGGTAPALQTKTQGVDLTLVGNNGDLVRIGYAFSGWNTASDGSGADYAVGATYSSDAALSLFAQWAAVPTYTVSYDGNGHVGGSVPLSQIKTEGVDLVLGANTGSLVKPDLIFAGWNTLSNGSGADYSAGVLYALDADLTLFAKWIIPPSADRIVTTGSDAGDDFTVGASLDSDQLDGLGFSLREAMIWAQEGEVIAFSGSVTVVTLTAEILIDKELTLLGGVVSGGHSSRVFYLNAGAGKTVTFEGVVIQAGSVTNVDGGGVYVLNGNVIFDGCLIEDCEATGTVSPDGGGVFLANAVEEATFIDTRVTDCSAARYGGGISSLAVDDSIDIRGCTIDGNSAVNGAGLRFYADASCVVSISQSTITGNVSSTQGGGISFDQGIFTVSNSTICDNEAKVTNGEQIQLSKTANVTLYSSIVAGGTRDIETSVAFTTGSLTITDCLYDSAKANVIVGTGSYTQSGSVDLLGADSLLDVLADNGGFTPTVALLSGSPAIDAGSNSEGFITDQRGTGFARLVGGQVDIGAFEVQGATPSYAVTYDGNSHTGGTAPIDQSKATGVDLTIATNSGSLVRSGYIFSGWNTASDGAGINYAEAATYSTDAALTLFAKWADNSADLGLLAHWEFDETSGSIAADSTGNGYDGTLEGSPSWTTGKIGGGLNTTGGYVAIPSGIPLTNEVTISLWSYGDAALPAETTVLRASNSDSQRVISINFPWSNETICFDCGNTGGSYDRLDKAASASDYKGQWNMWTFVKNATTGDMHIYLNGDLWASEAGNTRNMEAIATLTLGANIGGSEDYLGVIDDVRIYSTALTAEDIAQLYTDSGSTHTLSYTAGSHGSITGTSPQTVNVGSDGAAVTAVADAGYHFVDWSDASVDNPRTDLAVSGDVTVIANFAIDDPVVFATWVGKFGLTGGDAAGDADPDGDGVANLLEYFVGSDPLSVGTVQVSAIIDDGGKLSISYQSDNEAEPSDMTVVIQGSDDLGVSDPWTAVTATPSVSGTGPYRHTWTLNSELDSGGKIFLRIRITNE